MSKEISFLKDVSNIATHPMGITADELPHFVDQEENAMGGTLGIEIVFDPFAEVFDGEGESFFRAINPALGGFLILIGSDAPGGDDFVVMEFVCVPSVFAVRFGVDVEWQKFYRANCGLPAPRPRSRGD